MRGAGAGDEGSWRWELEKDWSLRSEKERKAGEGSWS